MSNAWRNETNTKRWRKIRARVLNANAVENQGRCQLAVPKVCTGRAEQVHHTRGKAYGDDERYLIAVCKACNLHVGNPLRHSPPPKPTSRW